MRDLHCWEGNILCQFVLTTIANIKIANRVHIWYLLFYYDAILLLSLFRSQCLCIFAPLIV